MSETADSSTPADPFTEVTCEVEGCAYQARPWATTWAHHAMSEHKDLLVTVPIEYEEGNGCDICGAPRAVNGPLAGLILHQGDCRG